MKEEKRKVQMTGGSTFVVSLPIKWAREAGIKQGDKLLLIPHGNNSLIITTGKEEKEVLKCANVDISPQESLEDNFRYLISHYLVGFNMIKLFSPNGFNADERKWIKEEVRKRLIGMEVVEEASKEIVLQSFLKYEDFTLKDAIKSMSKIILSMHGDAISSFGKRDRNLAEDVIGRDNEIDRFYLLIVRQLKAAMRNAELAKKIGIRRQRDSLGYRIIVKSMERIGDHVENIARNSMRISESENEGDGGSGDIGIGREGVERIKEAGVHTKNVFIKTLTSLSDMDVKKANEAIRAATTVIDMKMRMEENVLAGDWNIIITEKVYLVSILESLARIAKYCTDIAEVVINMGIKEAEELY
jgi:phosphate uptake regulator